MDTKLKNRHKFAIFLMIVVITIPSFVIGAGYWDFYKDTVAEQEKDEESYLCSESFLGLFAKSSYALYNDEMEENGKTYYKSVFDAYGTLYPYMDYQIEDEEGKVLQKSVSDSDVKLTEETFKQYALGIRIKYDEDGRPEVNVYSGDFRGRQETLLKKYTLNQSDNLAFNQIEDYELKEPKSRTFLYAMSEEQLEEFLETVDQPRYYMEYYIPQRMANEVIVLMLLVCAAAFLLPRWKTLHTGEEKIFCVPVEIPVLANIFSVSVLTSQAGTMLVRDTGSYEPGDFLLWTIFFALVYWFGGCIQMGWGMGFKEYLKKYTLSYKLWESLKKIFPGLKNFGKKVGARVYRVLEDIDLSDDGNKAIFKIILVNFLILLVLCTMWLYGIFGLVVYSVVIFFILRKYFNDIKTKYSLLLEATNKIADGNLDVEIQGELGIFEPFRNEIEKIQTGFKKAVDEEVKSQKMKTELITNVSHDLKTPLTAIITYVNLLKDEKDEEKRKDYVDVLERKSMRLKVLIEDLFEISKASSQNVTLDLVNVDIVNLFKQVKLELDDKIQGAGLEFRMELPEDKIILILDSQKTYRIFENLLVNVVKYAMPHTRVYVEMKTEGNEAVFRMKNISQQELNFNPEEITERFVRGDVSRNTEGSGLGLAIAKSFTQLQKGTFKIETEADLFKVEIRWILQ